MRVPPESGRRPCPTFVSGVEGDSRIPEAPTRRRVEITWSFASSTGKLVAPAGRGTGDCVVVRGRSASRARRRRAGNALGDRPGGELGARPEAELRQRAGDVPLDRPLADPEL